MIGGGPAGLMAAEVLLRQGIAVTIFDAMPTFGRKLLMAGRGGLNLTHSEPLEDFLGRYAGARSWLAPLVEKFSPDVLRSWAAGLGIETYVGSSGRVFPTEMKAAPLLRAWLGRLSAGGATFRPRHRWLGWGADGTSLRFQGPASPFEQHFDATLLALGGGSWRRLGSDGSWAPLLKERGVGTTRFRPSNCGFSVGWSQHLRERFAGAPLKPLGLSFGGRSLVGEAVITSEGIEGGAIYALSAALRDSLEQTGEATLMLDLVPGRSVGQLTEALAKPRGAKSLSNHLRRVAGIEGIKTALLYELLEPEILNRPTALAAALKALPLGLAAPRPIDEAISTAGGVSLDAIDARLMLRALPGIFCAGEMLDWEAPTGGYLLTACLATGLAAGEGVAAWIKATKEAA